MKSSIFMFSGTGNSLQTATIIGKELDADVYPFWQIDSYDFSQKQQKIILIFPTYYLHAPTFCLTLLKKICFSTKQLVLISTYAGSRGYALDDVQQALSGACSYDSLQTFCLRMPGSNYSEYPAFPLFIENYLFKQYNQKIQLLIKSILLNTKTKRRPPNFLAKTSNKHALKTIQGFKTLDRNFLTTAACVGCRACEKICPTANISVSDKKVSWQGNCSQCMGCVTRCPYNAIKIKNVNTKRKKYRNPSVSLIDLIKANR